MSVEKRQSFWPTTQVTLLNGMRNCEDSLSWKEFLQIYVPLIIKYCQRRGMQEEDARDVAQDVMVYVSKAMEKFCYDPEQGQFRNWLGTITHRTLLKHIARHRRATRVRSNNPNHHLATLDHYQSIGDVWMEVFAAHVYQTACQRLQLEFDHETWEAFELTFVDELPPDEVATQLNRTVGWVYQAKSKVVRRLRSELIFLAEDSALVEFVQRGVQGATK